MDKCRKRCPLRRQRSRPRTLRRPLRGRRGRDRRLRHRQGRLRAREELFLRRPRAQSTSLQNEPRPARRHPGVGLQAIFGATVTVLPDAVKGLNVTPAANATACREPVYIKDKHVLLRRRPRLRTGLQDGARCFLDAYAARLVFRPKRLAGRAAPAAAATSTSTRRRASGG